MNQLSPDKRKELADQLYEIANTWEDHTISERAADAIVVVAAAVFAAMSETEAKIIKAGGSSQLEAIPCGPFQPKRISDLMQQTRDHRAWVEADKAIAIEEQLRSALAARTKELADTVAAVNEFGVRIHSTTQHGGYFILGVDSRAQHKSAVEACLAAWRAKKPEVTDGN